MSVFVSRSALEAGHVQDYEDETRNAFCDSPIRLDSPIDAKEEELFTEEFDASLEGSTSSLFSSNLQFDLTEQNYRYAAPDATPPPHPHPPPTTTDTRLSCVRSNFQLTRLIRCPRYRLTDEDTSTSLPSSSTRLQSPVSQ